MGKITTIGLDLAKNVFHAVCCDEHGKVIKKKMLRRSGLLAWFANLPQSLVGMEACASAHYWARELQSQGHQVKLIPPQYVKPFVRGNKNDYNDALAIAEAVVRPEMRFVAIKTPQQQDIQALHRLRERRRSIGFSRGQRPAKRRPAGLGPCEPTVGGGPARLLAASSQPTPAAIGPHAAQPCRLGVSRGSSPAALP